MHNNFDRVFSKYYWIMENMQDKPLPALSEEEFKEFEYTLNKAKYALYYSLPLFATVLARCRTVPTYSPKVQTMAVDADMNIYINPTFAMKNISFDEFVGVLAHEVLHILNQTHLRKGHRNRRLWNIATDYIMNRDILIAGLKLPEFACIPVLESGRYIVVIPEENFRYDITDATAEELYKAMEQFIKGKYGTKKSGERNGNGGGGSGSEEGSTDGADTFADNAEEKGRMDKHIDQGDEKPEPADVPSDDPIYKPNEASKSAKDAQARSSEEIKKALDAANDILHNSKGRGNGAGGIRSFDASRLKPKVNWKSMLKNIFHKFGSVDRSFQTPSRKSYVHRQYFPGTVKTIDKGYIVVAIDVSGSVSKEDLAQFVRECTNIGKQYKNVIARYIFWHSEVTADITIDYKKVTPEAAISKIQALNIQSGGTIMSSVKNYIDAHPDKHGVPDAVIYVTDGYVESDPKVVKAKQVIILITNNGSDATVKNVGRVYPISI